MSKSGSLAIASPPSAIEALTPPCLCIDIETPPSGQAVIHKLAAFRPDSGDRLVVQGAAASLTTELDALTEGAGFVLGHNLRRHDLPVLGQVFPNLKLLALPVGELTPRDVDLGYAGRRAARHPAHAAIARLRVGDALDLVERELRDGAGRVVGRLAKGYALPDRMLAAVKVSAIVVRKPLVPEDQVQPQPKVDEWETVLCDLTFE